MSIPFRKKRQRPEEAIQKAICEYLGILAKQVPLKFFHVPNGGSRNKIEAANLKRLGVTRGSPDLVVMLGPIPSTKEYFLGFAFEMEKPKVFFIEVKSEKGRVSKEQTELWQWCVDNGFKFSVVRSVEEVADLMKSYIPTMAKARAA